MWNMLYALAASAALFLLIGATSLLSWYEASLPAFLLAIATYFVLARRSFKALEKIFNGCNIYLSTPPPRFDMAIAQLEKAYALTSVQFGVRSQVDTQIGVIYFIKQDFSKALPFLKRALFFGHWLGTAMLAVIYYKKKDNDEMRKTLEALQRRAGKSGLAWSLHAYLLQQIGDREGSQKVLTLAIKKITDDPRLREALLAIQNGKKIKMRGYKEQWYQFHLERPPTEHPQGLTPKISRSARRGRWG